MTSDAFLEIEDVRFSYGGAKVLRGVSLKVAEGDVICIIGANGAGKTTMLRIISGLEKPDGGHIRLKGKRLESLSAKKILALGVAQIPEAGRLFRDMSVYENLMIGAYLRHDKQAVAKDLKKVYSYFPVLATRTGQRAGQLSGGERQMVAVGRALMSSPRVLLMDEPSSGLAPKIVAMLAKIIVDINKDGISVVLVEQNAEIALNISRYGYVLERGRIALEGLTEELMTNDLIRKAYLGV